MRRRKEGAMTPPEHPRTIRDRIVELVRVRAGDLVPNPSNWRRHPGRQRAALRALLRKIGYADALLARREGKDLVLIDGHLRRSLDPEQVVPVLVLDLSEAEAELVLATLDPLAALAIPEREAVARLLERVHASSRAVSELLAEVARQAGLPHLRPRVDPEEIPTPPAEPKSGPGMLWAVGPHRILCGDATDPAALARLMGRKAAQVLFTDPPYGVSYVGKTPRALRIAGDEESGLAELLSSCFAAVSPHLDEGARIYLCHPAGLGQALFLQAFAAAGWRLHQTLVWVKDSMVLGHADYHYRHEPILYGYAPGPGRWGRGAKGWYGDNRADSVLEVPRPKASREHPTAKPVELIRRCLENSSKKGDVVLDPFAGSGSTLVAAAISGRVGLGMEIDPAYCDVIIERLERVTGDRARPEEGSEQIA